MTDKRLGIFIAIDGIDGSGKTTLSHQLCAALANFNPVLTKEPTAESEWGRRLRLSASEGRLPREMEIEFFHKDRIHHINTFIQPHLKAGGIVICDRYVDSTLAFQARNEDEAREMYKTFSRDILIPDITFILQCPVSLGLDRIHKNRPEKSTFEDVETLEHAATIYKSRMSESSKYIKIDASNSIENTYRQVVEALFEEFPYLQSGIIA